MNKTLAIIIVIVVILGGAYLLTRPATPTTNIALNTPSQTQTVGPTGRVVFSVTDDTANMSAISAVNMQVSEVDVHSATDGWVTVSTTPQTFDLLMLNAKSQSQLLVDANVKAGTYDQVRLMVSSISVVMKDGTTKAAKLPSNVLTINTNLVVGANATSSISLNFMASKSLHLTGNGLYIFTPVVKTDSKSSSDVKVNGDNTVNTTGGHVDDSNTSGMDVDGNVKANFQINDSQKLNIDSNGAIKLN